MCKNQSKKLCSIIDGEYRELIIAKITSKNF